MIANVRHSALAQEHSEMTIDLVPEHISVVSTLQESPYMFYLTGSRAGLGTPREDSDWDFFTQDNDEVREWLRNQGYRLHSVGYTDDPQIATVFRFDGSTISVDVQLIVDVSKKQRAQAAINKHHAIYGLNKHDARRVWKAMYELLS
jgi:hypothetical protein